MWTLVLLALTALSWLFHVAVGTSPDATHAVLEAVLWRLSIALTLASAVRLAQLAMFRLLPWSPSGGATDLFRAVLSVGLYLVGLMVYLHFILGQDLSSVLATSALVTAILGFALQPTLGNLFAGISIELEHPLRVGDCVRRGDIEGRVISLSWRSVSIRTARGSVIVLPNSDFTGQAVEVIAQNETFLHEIAFTVSGSHPPGKVMELALQVLSTDLPDVCRHPTPSVLVTGDDPASGALRYLARYHTRHFLLRDNSASALRERLWYALARQGINLPEPTSSVVRLARAHAPEPPLDAEFEGARLRASSVRRYCAGESVIVNGLARVIEGHVRVQRALSPEAFEQELARIARRLDATETPSAALLQAASLEALVHSATIALGPVAHELCAQVAALTDDPYLAWHAIASAVPDPEARARMLARAPAGPSWRLGAGQWLGWAQQLGLAAGPENATATSDSLVQFWSAQTLRAQLTQGGAGLRTLEQIVREQDPAGAQVESEALIAWLAQESAA